MLQYELDQGSSISQVLHLFDYNHLLRLLSSYPNTFSCEGIEGGLGILVALGGYWNSGFKPGIFFNKFFFQSSLIAYWAGPMSIS
jgi:hypothetical protein